MKFGILYNIDYQASVHGSASSYYEQILKQVELLEELGFDAAWFGEHHYSGYSFGNPARFRRFHHHSVEPQKFNQKPPASAPTQ